MRLWEGTGGTAKAADAAKADEWSTKLEAMKKPIPTMDIYLMKTS